MALMAKRRFGVYSDAFPFGAISVSPASMIPGHSICETALSNKSSFAETEPPQIVSIPVRARAVPANWAASAETEDPSAPGLARLIFENSIVGLE
jgi:hypothetical protein